MTPSLGVIPPRRGGKKKEHFIRVPAAIIIGIIISIIGLIILPASIIGVGVIVIY